MSKSVNYRKCFQEISDTKTYDRLDDFTDTQTLSQLDDDERNMLALTLLQRGQAQVVDGDDKAAESFTLAEDITTNKADILSRTGSIYLTSSTSDEISALMHAKNKFSESVKYDADIFDTWYYWGDTLVRLGLAYNSVNHFEDAHDKYLFAAQRLAPDDDKYGVLLWHWAMCWYHIGLQSGEAIDFHLSLEKFVEAEQLGCHDASFHNDYGKTLFEIGLLIGDDDSLDKAIEEFTKAVDIRDDFLEAMLSCAKVYCYLYNKRGIYFLEAQNSLAQASTLSDDIDISLQWGLLLLRAGQYHHDPGCLHGAVKKFENAYNLNNENPTIIGLWSETLISLGELTEQFDLLRDTEEKIIAALELFHENADLWARYGVCLNALGRYFQESEYYEEALDRFKYALTLDPSNVIAHRGLAYSSSLLGDYHQDIIFLESSVEIYGAPALSNIRDAVFLNEWGTAYMKLAITSNEEYHVEAAVNKFREALDWQRNNDSVDADMLYNYGCALDFFGDFDDDSGIYKEAVEVLTQALDIDPEFSDARYNLALAWVHLGEITSEVECFYRAIEYFQKIVDNDKEDDLAWDEWGVTLLTFSATYRRPYNPADNTVAYARSRGEVHAGGIAGERICIL